MHASTRPDRFTLEMNPAGRSTREPRPIAVILSLAGVFACANAVVAAGADALPMKQFYGRYCANCHGQNGSNPRLARVFPDLPDFSHPDWEATHTKAELTKSLLHGKGAMPAYQGDLRGHTAAEVIDYLRTLSQGHDADTGTDPPAADPPGAASADPPASSASEKPVAQFYQRYCASCHGAGGNNPKLARIFPDLPDFADPQWESSHTKSELTESILNGKGAMPAYKGDLRGYTPGELIDYLRTFSQNGGKS